MQQTTVWIEFAATNVQERVGGIYACCDAWSVGVVMCEEESSGLLLFAQLVAYQCGVIAVFESAALLEETVAIPVWCVTNSQLPTPIGPVYPASKTKASEETGNL